jgi:hypothetical protein
LLAPFADENVPRGERLRLLGRCIQHLKRLAGGAPVLVSAAPPDGVEAAEFLARLEAAADQVWRFESVFAGAGQPSTAELVRTLRVKSDPASQLRMF